MYSIAYHPLDCCKDSLTLQIDTHKLGRSGKVGFLNGHATKLFDAWQAFQQRLPIEEQNELNNRNPDWEDIRMVIGRVQAPWRAKNEGTNGTAISPMRDVLDTIHVHQTFLRILPESNNYASVFCGSLQVLIKVRRSDHETKLLYFTKNSLGFCYLS